MSIVITTSEELVDLTATGETTVEISVTEEPITLTVAEGPIAWGTLVGTLADQADLAAAIAAAGGVRAWGDIDGTISDQIDLAAALDAKADDADLVVHEAATTGVHGIADTSQLATLTNLATKQDALGYTPLNPGNNLSDVDSAATALTNLGAQASLGYTPVNKAGDTMAGPLDLAYQGLSGLFADVIIVNDAGGADATTLSAAVTQASALNPSSAHPVLILILPGSYTGVASQTIPQYVSIAALGSVALQAPSGARGPYWQFQGNQTITGIKFSFSSWTYGLAQTSGPGVVFNNCQFSTQAHDSGTVCYALQFAPSSTIDLLILNNCVFQITPSGAPNPVTADALLAAGTATARIQATNCVFFAKHIAGGGTYTAYRETRQISQDGFFQNCIFYGSDASANTQQFVKPFTGCVFNRAPIGNGASIADTMLRSNVNNYGDATAFIASSATGTPLRLRGAASQSGDLQQWQDSSGAVLSSVDANGRFVLTTISGTPTGTATVGTTMLDTSTNKLWVYTASGWKSTSLI